MAGLKLEIVQEAPFSSVEEEALLNLLRTSDCLHRAFHRKPATGASHRRNTTSCGFCAARSRMGSPVRPSASA